MVKKNQNFEFSHKTIKPRWIWTDEDGSVGYVEMQLSLISLSLWWLIQAAQIELKTYGIGCWLAWGALRNYVQGVVHNLKQGQQQRVCLNVQSAVGRREWEQCVVQGSARKSSDSSSARASDCSRNVSESIKIRKWSWKNLKRRLKTRLMLSFLPFLFHFLFTYSYIYCNLPRTQTQSSQLQFANIRNKSFIHSFLIIHLEKEIQQQTRSCLSKRLCKSCGISFASKASNKKKAQQI